MRVGQLFVKILENRSSAVMSHIHVWPNIKTRLFRLLFCRIHYVSTVYHQLVNA